MINLKKLYKSAVYHSLNNVYSKLDRRTSRHIVVFESDDWGSVRMPRYKDWKTLLKMGYAVDKRPYERFDTLESYDDVEALFEVLRKHEDSKGNHPIITANMLGANPDFYKIERSGYSEYYYESILDTYKKYHGNTNVVSLMKDGLEEGIFMPQCHGREHFNVIKWMNGLQSGNEDLLTAFNYGMCGIAPKSKPEQGNQLMNALLADNEEDQKAIDRILIEGFHMFEKVWGFRSKSFVAPCYLWSRHSESLLAKEGVLLIQTSRSNKSAYKSPSRFFYSGQQNRCGQVYSVRNCNFEPSTKSGGLSAIDLLSQVDKIFAQHKIAVISSHRINYVGGIDEANRSSTLRILDEFLTLLIQKYSDLEFLSSDKLIEVLKQQ